MIKASQDESVASEVKALVAEEINKTNTKTVQDTLVCNGSKRYAKQNNFASIKILQCRKIKHSQGRAKFEDKKKTLDKYLGKLSSEVNESNVSISAHISYHVYSAGPPQTKGDSEVKTKGKRNTPCIDSESGALRFKIKTLVIPESKDHAFYFMQILKIFDGEGGGQLYPNIQGEGKWDSC